MPTRGVLAPGDLENAAIGDEVGLSESIHESCRPPADSTRVKPSGKYIVAALSITLLLFTALALLVSRAKAPWIDEGWISISSWNLARHGSTGNPVMEPTGFWLGYNLPGIREINYLNMPLYMLVQGAWFRVFGFSLISMRALTILWGAVAIVAWVAVVESFAGIATALLAGGLMATDFTFLTSAADGRMDMMCMALWATGLAFYLRLREKSLPRAILTANIFIAASVFTHPNGAIGFLLLAVLVGTRDRNRLVRADILRCWPYAVGLAGWIAYIAIKPAWFFAQFGTNSGSDSGKLSLIPWYSLRSEIMTRNLAYFAGYIPWGFPTPHSGLAVIILYWLAVGLLIRRVRNKRLESAGTMVLITATIFGILTFLLGFKSPNYIVNIIPAYAGCVAVLAVLLFRDGKAGKVLSMALVGSLVCFQIVVIKTKAQSTNRSDYLATSEFIRRHVRHDALIAGSSAFFFDLRDFNLTDDMKAGFGTHIHPDFLIVDRMYGFMWDRVFPYSQPGTWFYLQRLMKHDATLVFRRGEYSVYSVQ